MGDKKNAAKADLLMKAEEVSFADTADGIRISAPYMQTLAMLLSNNKPEDISVVAEKQLGVIVAIADQGDVVRDEREAVAQVRPWRVDFVSAWGGFHDTLVARSRTPASVSDEGERAMRLIARIFPEGAGWLRKDAYAAWSDGNRVLKRIAELRLEGEIDELVGAAPLDAAKKTTTALGEALGVGTTRKTTPSTTSVAVTLAAFSREVARYSRMIAAETDVTDAASVERFLRAVQRPIDRFRSRRGANGELEPVDPLEPTDPGVEPVEPVEPVVGE